jgi:3-oxoacyl-[acyl-carrier protein] reductase
MNKTVIITGARRGLGLEITKKLVADGFKVVVIAKQSSAELDSLCKKGNVFLEIFDLSKVERIHELTVKLTKRYGRIYGLINNAAIGSDGILGTMHEINISEALRVNLESPIVLTKYISRSMLLGGEGRIVNITSIIASAGFSGLSVYAATKAGLQGFSKSLSRELGKLGITVNAVAPGFLDTDMTRGIDNDKFQSILRRSPSGKLASLESVATTVGLLMSPAGGSISGATITVDAGSTA